MTDRWKAKIASHSPWKTPQRCPHFHRCEYDYALKQKGIIIDREREKYLTMIKWSFAGTSDGAEHQGRSHATARVFRTIRTASLGSGRSWQSFHFDVCRTVAVPR